MLAPPRGVCSREPGALTCTAPTIPLRLRHHYLHQHIRFGSSRGSAAEGSCNSSDRRRERKALALLQTKTALVLVLVQVQVLVLVLFCVLVLVLVLVLGWFCCWLLGWFCCWLLVRLLFTPLRASERPLNIL